MVRVAARTEKAGVPANVACRAAKLIWRSLALLLFLLPVAAVAQQPDFTVIALPDTQYYSASYPAILNAQVQWIVNNKTKLNIQMVIGEGDIVNGGGSTTQWTTADSAYKMLDAAHIPYFAAIGNHDYDANNPPSRTSATKNFNHYFGPSRYQNPTYWPTPYWLGSFPTGSNENFYGTVNVEGQTYLVMALEFYPRDSSLSWAANVIANNPDKPVIIVTHSYEYFDNSRVSACNSFDAQYYGMASDNDGDAMWAKLVRQFPNTFLVLSGHIIRGSGQYAAGHRVDLGDNGNLVNQILANYQNMTDGGEGYLRIMTFHPSSDTISVTTYSPYLSGYLTDSNNQFTVPWHNWTGTGNGSIAGLVKNISTCSALAGASIATPGTSAIASSTGAYAISNLAPGIRNVTASDSGYTPVTKSVNVGPGMTASAKFFLGTGAGQIGGSVTSSAGGAISGADVHLVGSSSSGVDEVITTDSTGLYSSGSIPGGTYQVTAAAVGYSSSTTTVSLGSGASLNQSFVLTPTTQTLAVTSITPNSGPTTGGTAVTLAGSGFESAATVAIGGNAAMVTSISANSITATTPAGTAGPADVLVTNPDGTTATLTGGFTYTTPSSITISSVTPNSGPTSGGTSITIAGSGFASGATVTIGSAAATVSSVTATSIMATTPAGAAGAVNVTVTNPNGGGTATLAGGFTYMNTSSSSTITGTVTKSDTTVVLAGAAVKYSGGSTTTNSSGAYTLTNVPAGSAISVTASLTGYQSLTQKITPAAGSTSTLNFALLPTCTASTVNPSVTICLPTANSNVLNPVHIIAKTTDTHTVSYIQIYIDGTKKYQVSGGSLNTTLTLTTGVSHRLTVQATDSAAQIFKQTIYVTAH